ncbi:hypothetical protein BDZ89DRAFT_1231838 [Hymenopellis radicata]|nr:hypothetical protein BDZ89DRAFT_1231838 [Hymenopellis radicata]
MRTTPGQRGYGSAPYGGASPSIRLAKSRMLLQAVVNIPAPRIPLSPRHAQMRTLLEQLLPLPTAARTLRRASREEKEWLEREEDEVEVLADELAQTKALANDRLRAMDALHAEFDGLQTRPPPDDQNMEVISEELHRQADYLRQLEMANTKIKAELARNGNVDVLREEKRTLERRVRSMKELRRRIFHSEEGSAYDGPAQIAKDNSDDTAAGSWILFLALNGVADVSGHHRADNHSTATDSDTTEDQDVTTAGEATTAISIFVLLPPTDSHPSDAPSEEIARQCMKAKVRALARHYQRFEQLPVEKRGGLRASRSLLCDETVRTAARDWLMAQKTPLSERTARRWLVKLGFRRTVFRKGVYVDGHERPDVVKYRDEEFLPTMAKYERRMTQYELRDGVLVAVPPTLAPGEKEIIAQFHDESSFHANEYMSSAWLTHGQQKLQKKTRGRLIHVSDFVNEATGRLVVRNDAGEVIEDARKVIYPGSKGDPWWEVEQLLVQVKAAIKIFEKAHPNCQALFVFDNSSSHAALGSDALHAFEMNMSNGGKQRFQKDTIIPDSDSVPAVHMRGKPQKMKTDDGLQKGLKQVLEERGFNVTGMRAKCKPVCPFENTNCCMARLLSHQEDFANQVSMLEQIITEAGHLCIFLPKFHCELNPIEMYWGWCKHRYREIEKNSFAEAKAAAFKCLDGCPTEVIRKFVNRSWRFMDAYRKGLTGDAATWAVKNQKGHRRVSQRAMMNIESVLNH